MMPPSVQWRLAVRNLKRNYRRNAVSAVMIGVAFASMALVSAHGYRIAQTLAANSAYNNHLGQFVVYKRGGLERALLDPVEYQLDRARQDALVERLAALPDVEFVGRYLQGEAMVSNGCVSVPVLVTGVDLTVENRVRRHPVLKRWWGFPRRSPDAPTLADLGRTWPHGIMITERIADVLGKSKIAAAGVPDHFAPVFDCDRADAKDIIASHAEVQLTARTVSGDSLVEDATIVGHQASGRLFTDDVAVTASLPFAQELFRTGNVTYLAVFLREGASVDNIMKHLRNSMGAAADDLDLFASMGPEINALDHGTLAWHSTVETFIQILIDTIVAIIIVNFISLALLERQHEIGTMQALGFYERDVLTVFQKESLLLSAAGAALGAALTWLAVIAVNGARILYHPPTIAEDAYFLLAVDPWSLVAKAAILIVITTVSTRLVVWRVASRHGIVSLIQQPV